MNKTNLESSKIQHSNYNQVEENRREGFSFGRLFSCCSCFNSEQEKTHEIALEKLEKNQYNLNILSYPTDKKIANFSNQPIEENLIPKNDPKSFKVFEDKEIIKVHPLRDANHDFGSEVVRRGESGKTVILQQGTTSCTQAVTAMILLDHNKNINEDYLSGSHGSNNNIIKDLKEKGLNPLEYLPENIQKIKTPSIVTLNIDGNGHVVIVDDIKKDAVTIRDPYHGWMVDVEKESFTKAVVLKEKAIFIQHIPIKRLQINEIELEINKGNRPYPKANLNENVLLEEKSDNISEKDNSFHLNNYNL